MLPGDVQKCLTCRPLTGWEVSNSQPTLAVPSPIAPSQMPVGREQQRGPSTGPWGPEWDTQGYITQPILTCNLPPPHGNHALECWQPRILASGWRPSSWRRELCLNKHLKMRYRSAVDNNGSDVSTTEAQKERKMFCMQFKYRLTYISFKI